MLKNECLIAKFGFDTAESEPAKNFSKKNPSPIFEISLKLC